MFALPGAERSEALLITAKEAALAETASQLRFLVGIYHTNAVTFTTTATPPSPADPRSRVVWLMSRGGVFGVFQTLAASWGYLGANGYQRAGAEHLLKEGRVEPSC